MPDTIKFKGVPYPVTDDPLGLLRTQNGINQIKSDLLSLLLTNPGERPMLLNFGIGFRQFIFEPNDNALTQQIRDVIANQLRLWEPRVVIQQIDVTIPTKDDLYTGDSLENILLIRISFLDPENIQDVQVLALEVPLNG